MSLLETLAKRSPEEYKGCVTLAISRLSRVRFTLFSLLLLLSKLISNVSLWVLMFYILYSLLAGWDLLRIKSWRSVDYWISIQIVTSSYTDLQDYTYYFVPAPWLSVKLLHLLQNYPPSGEIEAWMILGSCSMYFIYMYDFVCSLCDFYSLWCNQRVRIKRWSVTIGRLLMVVSYPLLVYGEVLVQFQLMASNFFWQDIHLQLPAIRVGMGGPNPKKPAGFFGPGPPKKPGIKPNKTHPP